MSDPKNQAVLTSRDIGHIVESAGTHSLVSASLMSSRVIAEAAAYLERSAQALEQILCVVEGHDKDGKPKLMSVIAQLDPGSAKAISDTMVQTVQPQIDKLGGTVTDVQTKIGDLTQAATKNDHAIAGVQTHLGDLAKTTANHEQTLAFAVLGDGGHIRRLDAIVVEQARRIERLEENPRTGVTSGGTRPTANETREVREANEALRERITAMEDAIRQLLARGPQGGPRSTRPR